MEASRYYVFGKDTPTVFHGTLNEASTEAKRLAKLNPGTEFFVLRAVKSICYMAEPFIQRSFCKS